jgi:hypothetical protein
MNIAYRFTCILSLGLVACSSDEQPGAPASPTDGGSHDARPMTPKDSGHHVTKDSGKPPPKPDASKPKPDAEAGTTPDADADIDAGAPPYPPLLSETGLYSDLKKGTLGQGVRAYEVRYPLWSDGMEKKRWVYLPPGKKIDTTDQNFWVYPQGMKAWKEFSADGKRIETRMQWKAGPNPEDWVMIAYQWKADGSDAVAVPLGVVDASGVPSGVPDASGVKHDIPSTDDCQFCHGNMKDRLLGFNAIQLSHDLPGVKISDLITENAFTKPPSGPFLLPGATINTETTATKAIGHLHGNCGDCHNPTSTIFVTVDMQLWEDTGKLDTLQNTTAYRTAVNQPSPGSTTNNRIVPSDPTHSQIWVRMGLVGAGQMPPIARETVDVVGRGKVEAWIKSLPPITDGGTDAGGSLDGG